MFFPFHQFHTPTYIWKILTAGNQLFIGDIKHMAQGNSFGCIINIHLAQQRNNKGISIDCKDGALFTKMHILNGEMSSIKADSYEFSIT